MAAKCQSHMLRAMLATLAVAVASGSYAGDAQTIPSTILGKWLVTAAHVDHLATRTMQYAEGDPRLVGRIFTFSPDKIENNTADNGGICREPTASVRKLDSKVLFAKSFGGRLSGRQYVTPDDFGLGDFMAPRVEVVSVLCQGKVWNAGVGVSGELQGSWIAMSSSEIAFIHWYDDMVLTLARLPASAVPTPSFSCKAAKSQAERTICGSLQLSWLDQSISMAYRQVLADRRSSGEESGKVELVQSQIQWLKKRDGCVDNEVCLTDTMNARLQEFHDLQ